MTEKITNTQYYSDIADAIRRKNNSLNTYTPSQMAPAIRAIEFQLPQGIMFGHDNVLSRIDDLDLSVFKIDNITDTSGMFSRLGGMRGTLDISNFDFTNVTTFTNMFGTNSTGVYKSCVILVKDQAAKD